MGRKVCLPPLVLFALIAQFLPRSVWAQGQSVYGAITGVVSDPSGAGIPNAKLTAINTATGVQSVVVSDSAGYYIVSSLTAGTYSLEVSAPGFRTLKQETIPGGIDRTVKFDLTLTVGNVQQQVTVTGDPPALETEKVEVAETITRTELESIPTAYNNATGLVKLLPGVMEAPGENGLPSMTGRRVLRRIGERRPFPTEPYSVGWHDRHGTCGGMQLSCPP